MNFIYILAGQITVKLLSAIQKILRKYTVFLMLNKNMLISGTAGFFASAVITQLYSEYSDSNFFITLITIASGFAISIPVFAALFYHDIRNHYKNSETAAINNSVIKHIYKRVIEIGSVFDIVYIISRFIMLYYLLNTSVEPFQASMLSSITSSLLSYITVNLVAKKLGLYESSKTKN